jgi:hypothetical protein
MLMGRGRDVILPDLTETNIVLNRPLQISAQTPPSTAKGARLHCAESREAHSNAAHFATLGWELPAGLFPRIPTRTRASFILVTALI